MKKSYDCCGQTLIFRKRISFIQCFYIIYARIIILDGTGEIYIAVSPVSHVCHVRMPEEIPTSRYNAKRASCSIETRHLRNSL